MKKILFSALTFILISLNSFAQWTTSGTNVYYNGGSVGIGISGVSNKLALKQSDDVTSALKIYNNSNRQALLGYSSTYFLDLQTTTNDNLRLGQITASGTGHVAFFTNASERIRIHSNGNVGIGTTSPSEKLSVYGQDISFFSGTYYNQLEVGRNLNENFRLYVGDNDAFLDYNQDSDADTEHVFRIRNLAQGTSEGNDIRFSTSSGDKLIIKGNGNIGIATTSPSEKLEVNGNALFQGNIETMKVKVTQTPGNWPDYVFSANYQLTPLEEVEQFIQQNQHLPDVPSAKDVETNGLDLGDMEATLLKKIEELTLYTIEQEKRLEVSDARYQTLDSRYQKLENENSELKVMLLEMKKEIESIKKQ